MVRNIFLLILLVTFIPLSQLKAQDLMDMLKDEKPPDDYAYATFKTTRVILGQSIENPAKGTLQFLIEHNFGRINKGAYEFFGLDLPTVIRFGLEYGINDWLSVSAGRSNFEKTVDGSFKAKILRQCSGDISMPISLSWYSDLTLNTAKFQDLTRKNYFSSRISYVNQVLIARKFSSAFSLQLSPTFVHKNLVPTRTDANNIFVMGVGGRVKVAERTSLNAEYFYMINGNADKSYHNTLSVGCDLETGGHVFQFRFTNAQPMIERAFMTENTDDWTKGDVYFGFTINRVFTIVNPKNFQKN